MEIALRRAAAYRHRCQVRQTPDDQIWEYSGSNFCPDRGRWAWGGRGLPLFTHVIETTYAHAHVFPYVWHVYDATTFFHLPRRKWLRSAKKRALRGDDWLATRPALREQTRLCPPSRTLEGIRVILTTGTARRKAVGTAPRLSRSRTASRRTGASPITRGSLCRSKSYRTGYRTTST